MKVLVCGSSGCIGSAVQRALQSRGHQVVQGSRKGDAQGLRIDFMAPVPPEAWAERLRALRIDAVVNCVGLLMERDGQRFERVHAQGPIELFRGAALAGVQRVVQVSALGADTGNSAYLATKRQADEALLGLPITATVLRPSLVYGPACASTALFATLAALPVVALPGGGGQRLRPIHVYEVAEIVARCIEGKVASAGVFEIGGGDTLSYRDMMGAYRHALHAGDALWLPVPMALMRLTAWAAEALPQKVFCRETIALLARGSEPAHNAAGALLGRAPTGMAAGLAISPPAPWLNLHAEISPALAWLLRGALAFMWLWMAAASLMQPPMAFAAVTWSCAALNVALGLGTLLAPGPRLYALQSLALVGYTVVVALNLPGLASISGAALAINLPVLAAVLLLWLATPAGVSGPHAALTRSA